MTAIQKLWAVMLAAIFACGLTGCGRDQASGLGTPTKPAGESSEEAPGPQSEPPLTESTGRETAAETTPANNGALTVALVDREGLNAILAKHKGKVVLVDYWATWCGPCRKKFPHTVALAKEHQADGLVVVTVSMDDEDNHDEVVEFLMKQQADFENVRSRDGGSDEAFAAFEVPGNTLPCLKLYDRAGQLAKTFAFDSDTGPGFTDEDVAQGVKAELAKAPAGN